MTAEPAPRLGDPLDPERILADLPEDERPFFLAQYRETAEGIADPARWKELHRFLRLWRFHADATHQPGYWEDREAAENETGGGMLLEDYIRMRLLGAMKRLLATREGVA
jgi:hypothetical protein